MGINTVGIIKKRKKKERQIAENSEGVAPAALNFYSAWSILSIFRRVFLGYLMRYEGAWKDW